VKVLKTIVDDSEIVKKLTCGRTKATSLVNNVLYPVVLEYALERLVSNNISKKLSGEGVER
jgi:hypothetical protein